MKTKFFSIFLALIGILPLTACAQRMTKDLPPVTTHSGTDVLALDVFSAGQWKTRKLTLDALSTIIATGGSSVLPYNLGGTGLSVLGTAGQVLRTNAGATALEWTTLTGGGNALTSSPLSQFAATTSAQLRGVMGDESGTGALLFANGNIGNATGGALTTTGEITSQIGLVTGTETQSGLVLIHSGNALGSGSIIVSDATAIRENHVPDVDGTFVITSHRLNLVGISAERTFSVPDEDIEVVGAATAQTISNKTLSTVRVTLGSDATGDIYYRHTDGTLKRIGVGSAGQVLTVASGIPSWATPSGGPSTVRITSDLAATSSTTSSDATGLSFAVTSGVAYHYKFHVLYQTAATTTGVGVGLTFPAVTLHSAAVNIFGRSAQGSSGNFFGWFNTSGEKVVSTSVEAANTTYSAIIEGVITPSATGTLQLQVASEVSGSNVIIKAGTCGFLTTLP